MGRLIRPRPGPALLALSLLCCGCSSGPRLVRVTGSVTSKGHPVAKLVVNFVPAEGRPSWGLTDKDGKFKLHYDREHEGAITGQHKVWLEYRPFSPKEEEARASGTLQLSPELSRILEKYGNREEPLLSVDVKEDNQVINLALD